MLASGNDSSAFFDGLQCWWATDRCDTSSHLIGVQPQYLVALPVVPLLFPTGPLRQLARAQAHSETHTVSGESV